MKAGKRVVLDFGWHCSLIRHACPELGWVLLGNTYGVANEGSGRPSCSFVLLRIHPLTSLLSVCCDLCVPRRLRVLTLTVDGIMPPAALQGGLLASLALGPCWLGYAG